MGVSQRLHAVVIAGGSGTRFWPLSRQAHPKQLLNLSGEDSLLHATFARVSELIPPSAWWMVVGAHHAEGCRRVAPEVASPQVLVEPRARNTAPAIALAAAHLARQAPDSVMAVLPADHHVADSKAFCTALSRAETLAARGEIVTLGIKPTHPETGFGYIERGAENPEAEGAFRISRFREKPTLAQAKAFLEQGTFVWNAGIFVMHPLTYLEEVRRQLPKLHAALTELMKTFGTPAYPQQLHAAYEAIDGISIDYGIMEHVAQASVVPVDCGWSDVGSWSALGTVVPQNAEGNVVRGRSILLDTRDSVIYADEGHVVATVGVTDLVVVHTRDATLVVPKDRAQEVRLILDNAGAQGWRDLL